MPPDAGRGFLYGVSYVSGGTPPTRKVRPCSVCRRAGLSNFARRYAVARRRKVRHQVANLPRISDPPRRRRPAVLRTAVEGDGCLRRSAPDGVDHRFEQNQPTWRQPDARADHHAVVVAIG